MSYDVNQKNHPARRVPCDECKAESGETCYSTIGTRAPILGVHTARINKLNEWSRQS